MRIRHRDGGGGGLGGGLGGGGGRASEGSDRAHRPGRDGGGRGPPSNNGSVKAVSPPLRRN